MREDEDLPMNDDDAAMRESAGSTERSEPGAAARRAGPPRPALLGAGVVGVIVLVLLAVFLPRPEDGSFGQVSPSPSASTSPPTLTAMPSPSASPPTETRSPTTAEPTPRPGAAEVGWAPGTRLDGTSAVVERIGSLWFIGGSASSNGGQQAAVWASADGQVWDGPTLLPPEPPLQPADQPEDEPWFPESYAVTGFAAWDGALYAFGRFHFGCCDGLLPMLWQSLDNGEIWSEVKTEGTPFFTGQIPMEATTTPSGELAIFSLTGLGGSASVFTTSDLQTWTDNPIPRGDSDELLQFSGFASSPEAMVLVGFDIPPFSEIEERRPRQRAWNSADGRTWSPMSPPEADGELWDVAWDRTFDRWVVVGTDDTGRPRVWLSDDGVSWATSPLAEQEGQVHEIAAADGLIAAVGAVQPPAGSEGIRTVWTSHDGVGWSVATIDGSAPFAEGSIAVAPESAVIAFGLSDGGSETWIGLLAE
jgi:hypothetical protein